MVRQRRGCGCGWNVRWIAAGQCIDAERSSIVCSLTPSLSSYYHLAAIVNVAAIDANVRLLGRSRSGTHCQRQRPGGGAAGKGGPCLLARHEGRAGVSDGEAVLVTEPAPSVTGCRSIKASSGVASKERGGHSSGQWRRAAASQHAALSSLSHRLHHSSARLEGRPLAHGQASCGGGAHSRLHCLRKSWGAAVVRECRMARVWARKRPSHLLPPAVVLSPNLASLEENRLLRPPHS